MDVIVHLETLELTRNTGISRTRKSLKIYAAYMCCVEDEAAWQLNSFMLIMDEKHAAIAFLKSYQNPVKFGKFKESIINIQVYRPYDGEDSLSVLHYCHIKY
jgi:hypothetical protein